LKSKEILESSDPFLGSLDAILTDPKCQGEELDFSPSLPKSRTKHLSLFKSRSYLAVNEANDSNPLNNTLKHHTSFTEEYDDFHKQMTNIDPECFGISNEKKIIRLKKIDSNDFQFLENPDFSEERLNPQFEEDRY